MIGKLFPFAKSNKKTRSAPPAMRNILSGIFSDLPVRREWLRHDAFARIERDDQVIATLGSRKAATLKKELLIDSDDSDAVTALRKSFPQHWRKQALDVPLQGMGVFEINWEEDDETPYWRPVLVERPFRDFVVRNGELRYDPFGTGTGEAVIPHKAVFALHDPKHDRPMGTALANALFWPVKLKGASLDFWIRFLEKYGVPWTIGKTEDDRETMANEIYNMLSGDAAVIGEDDSIETVVTQKVGDYDKLVAYCDTQIAKVILGGNLTSEVKGGSLAAAQTHNDIREDIAMTDEHIIVELMESVIASFREINGIAAPVTVRLKDKDDPNLELSERDERIAGMGWQPTKEYIESTYNITVEAARPVGPVTNRRPDRLLHFSTSAPGDEIDRNLPAIETEPIERELFDQIDEALGSVDDFDAALEAIARLYPDMSTAKMESVLERYMLNADLLGSAEIEDETGEGDAGQA